LLITVSSPSSKAADSCGGFIEEYFLLFWRVFQASQLTVPEDIRVQRRNKKRVQERLAVRSRRHEAGANFFEKIP